MSDFGETTLFTTDVSIYVYRKAGIQNTKSHGDHLIVFSSKMTIVFKNWQVYKNDSILKPQRHPGQFKVGPMYIPLDKGQPSLSLFGENECSD